MRAKLEYVLGCVRVPLEVMELEELDQFTYNNFESEEDIVTSPMYKDKIRCVSKEGKVMVTFKPEDMPIHVIDRYAALGGNPMARGVEGFRVLTNGGGVVPTKRGMFNATCRLFDKPEVAEEFYRYFESEYSPKDRLDHLIGMMSENNQLVSNGVFHTMGKYFDGYDGYFVGRAFYETVANFESVAGKDNAKEKVFEVK